MKTITATALMQLAEREQIDLDQDINQYLSTFHIPDTYPELITARELLHYTAGLDSKFVGIRVPDPAQLMPLADYLAQHLPPRTRAPGAIRAYNDHEIALAGLLVTNLRDRLRGDLAPATRLHNSVLLLAGLGFIFFVHTWNLLGWRF